MIKAEPKTILSFIHQHFDLLKELFLAQSRNNSIDYEFLSNEIEKYGVEIKHQLFEYQILKNINDEYQITDVYYNLFEFILQQFKPLLPEEIEKYVQSITNLFIKIKEDINKDKNILIERIDSLTNEIDKFLSQVKNNTSSLLIKSRDLKANIDNIDYQEKIHKASFWIEYYIIPLNNIIDIHNSESIYNILLNISEYTNEKRLNFQDENIRLKFERLYNRLKQTLIDIRQQSEILVNELIPLIERIKTENSILKGMHHYLSKGLWYKRDSPQKELLQKFRDNVFSNDFGLSTKEYFEQFQLEEEVFINDDSHSFEDWIFDKIKYKERMVESLPIQNFFEWTINEIKSDNSDFNTNQYFTMVSLLFEKDINIEYQNKYEKIIIEKDNTELKIPVLKITKDEN